MLLGGLWHGASWNFVIWGLIHGSYLVGERLLGLRTASGWRALRLPVTTLLVMLAWVPFRSPTLEQAGTYLVGLAGRAGVEASLSPAWWGLIALLGLIQYALGGVDVLGAAERVPAPAFAPAYGLAVAWILPWAAANYRPFIYFQF